MTAEDLWNEYRDQCCPPDLQEPGGSIYWQKMAFMAGVTAAIGNIIIRPACFEELRESLSEWMESAEMKPLP